MYFEIVADYRPNNFNKPVYYVEAGSAREAKKKFSNIISWLKIYGCQKISEEDADMVRMLDRQNKIILIG